MSKFLESLREKHHFEKQRHKALHDEYWATKRRAEALDRQLAIAVNRVQNLETLITEYEAEEAQAEEAQGE